MRALVLIITLALAGTGCGRILSAIPRHTEIERPVTAQEVVGRWVLTTNSVSSVKVDGFSPTAGEEVALTLRSNGSYSCHMIFPRWDGKQIVERAVEDGKWSLDYSSTNHFKNALVLRSERDAVSSLHIALDSQRMVLWRSWGDPDDGIDLVFEKVTGE